MFDEGELSRGNRASNCPADEEEKVLSKMEESDSTVSEGCPLCGCPLATSAPARYCSHCGACLVGQQSDEQRSLPSAACSRAEAANLSLIEGQLPKKEEILSELGRYQLLRLIGQGGMGEVFLAYDTACGRRIALKKIRQDLVGHKQLYDRFLKEAYITSQLTHPSIIPIYTIHRDAELVYYTMPFVGGATLKELLRKAHLRERRGLPLPSFATIPAFMRIFHSVCNAVAYAHSHRVLHRDLKPENIIIGEYGQVHILDWGLAKLLEAERTEPLEELSEGLANPLVTRLGKVVGTISYMAPERALGHPATVQSDIYSLGVILYQLLTLRLPFHRKSLQEFRSQPYSEPWYDLAELVPYRDVPRALARMAERCLAAKPEERYQQLSELLNDLESYVEGRSEWILATELQLEKKDDWEFQEHVLLPAPTAIAPGGPGVRWVTLMVSKASFTGNTRVEVKLRFGPTAKGLGLMLCIPEAAERLHINDGYCLWMAAERGRPTRLLRSYVELISRPDIALERDRTYVIRLEKIANNLHVYLDGQLLFSFISHLPLAGTHVGLLSEEGDFALEWMRVYVSSLNITVNCLAVPDAFLAHKQYGAALSEYRRIAYSFPGRTEGREALFSAGITLLEQARSSSDPSVSRTLFEEALEEFEKQRHTPGAPLEYAGKALVYRALGEWEEEAKCYELAMRRYRGHPLLPRLYEQLIYRVHESSKSHRKAAYQLLLVSIRFLPKELLPGGLQQLFEALQAEWEPLDFLLPVAVEQEEPSAAHPLFALQLAFWLAHPYVIDELCRQSMEERPASCWQLLFNGLLALIELGSRSLAAQLLAETEGRAVWPTDRPWLLPLLRLLLTKGERSAAQVVASYGSCLVAPLPAELLACYPLLMRYLFQQEAFEEALELSSLLLDYPLSYLERQQVDQKRLWPLFALGRWHQAGQILHSYPLELLSHESTPFHFLYGCWLLMTEGMEMADIHFHGIVELAYPRSWTLMAHQRQRQQREEMSRVSEGSPQTFLWERRQLWQQLILFYRCAGDRGQEAYYRELESKEYVVE